MKYSFISILFFLVVYSCQNKTDEPIIENSIEEEAAQQDVANILKSNPSIQVGPLQEIQVDRKVYCTGIIDLPPSELIAIHSKMAGFVENIRFLPGDYVRRGQQLLSVSNPELLVKQRTLLQTKVELELAVKEFDRETKLQQAQATSSKAFDQALANKELLSVRYHGLLNELALIGVNVEALEKEQKYQSKIYLYAPVSGSINSVTVNRGQMIAPHDRLMELANRDHLHIELDVFGKDIGFIKVGQAVSFSLMDQSEVYQATVLKITPILNTETGTLRVHCHIVDGQEVTLIPGTTLTAEIFVESQKATGLPTDAVLKEGQDYFIYVVEGNAFKKVQVDQVTVEDGYVLFDPVKADQVVVKGAYYVE